MTNEKASCGDNAVATLQANVTIPEGMGVDGNYIVECRDADGNLNNWWTDADSKAFQLKIKDVIKQYETFAARDGIKFDAAISVGEDLADISGMALIESYLLDNQVINEDGIKIKKTNLMLLYMNLAIQARQQIYKKAIKAQLKMNPHPLEKYRVNCSLARLELFKTIYGIKKGDGMWWNNDTIW